MKRIALSAACLVVLGACGQNPAGKADAAAITVEDALCRPTPNGRDMTACYMTLTAPADDRLMSIAAPDAARAELHEMKTENGMMRMAGIVGGLPLPSGQAVTLAPGGNHVMLLGLSRPLAQGDTVSLTLGFEKAEPVTVVARVGQPALPASH